MSEQQPSVRFESTDINIRGVLLTGIGVLLGVLAIVFLMHLFFAHMRRLKAQESAPTSPMLRRESVLPPEPRLQDAPRMDYETMKADAEWKLHNYQWIDRQKGIVSIPIDKAMDLLVQRGIPPTQAQPNQFYRPQEGDRLTGFEERKDPQP